MELGPPTYSEAISRNHWPVVAPYIRTEDLPSACLVNKQWHRAFAPQLWGNPMQNSGFRFDDPWFGLRRFERIVLYVATLEVRQLTHTLDIPVDVDSLHVDVGKNWLYNLISRLPRLQSLLVTGVPYFDQNTLSTMFKEMNTPRHNSSSLRFTPHLRLLDASHCKNLSGASVWNISQLFPNLVYLDLSATPGKLIIPSACVRGEVPLKSISSLRNLRVLKLRNCRLDDAMVHSLALAIEKRIRSLDIRDNPLTNSSLEVLLNWCFVKTEDSDHQIAEHQTRELNSTEEPPSYERQELHHQSNGQGLATRLYHTLTLNRVDRLALEDDTNPGLTQLQVNMSTINQRSLLKCLECPNLRYLDAQAKAVEFDSTDETLTSHSNVEFLRIPHLLFTQGSRAQNQDLTFETQLDSQLNLQKVLETRHNRAQKDQSDFMNLMTNLQKLKTLTITDIPNHASNSVLSKRLIALLSSFGVSSSLARSQAHFEFSQSSKNTKHHLSAEQKRAGLLYPLNRIVLEVVSSQPEPQSPASRGWNLPSQTKSVTGDKDSESIWDIANNDYTFFDSAEEGEELDSRHDVSCFQSLFRRKDRSSGSNMNDDSNGSTWNSGVATDSNPTATASKTMDDPPNYLSATDTIAAIVAFRQESRKKFMTSKAQGTHFTTVQNYFDSTVSVSRM